MPIVAVTKVDQVRQAILEDIFSGKLRPGERLREAQLSKELGVSQATVNAALQDLHDQGLVTKILNRSTTVNRYTKTELDNLFAVRMIIEPAVAEAVATRWSETANVALREKVDQMRRAARTKDLAKFLLSDYTFHQELYRLSQNPFLIQACAAIAAGPFAYILCDCREELPTDYLSLAEDHQDLVLAMQDGPKAAGETVRKLVQQWRDHSFRALAAAGRRSGVQSTSAAEMVVSDSPSLQA
jgi:DNA-binding GntR family transcriptional regulator